MVLGLDFSRFTQQDDSMKNFMILSGLAQIGTFFFLTVTIDAFLGFSLNFFPCIIPAIAGLAVSLLGRSFGMIQLGSVFAFQGLILWLYFAGSIFVFSLWWILAVPCVIGIGLGFVRGDTA